MKNTTSIKVPKIYQDKIEIIEQDSDGYWAYSKDGYHFEGMGYGCHIAHEDTQKELMSMIRTLGQCDCEECTHETCEDCNGQGSISGHSGTPTWEAKEETWDCPECHGSGKTKV